MRENTGSLGSSTRSNISQEIYSQQQEQELLIQGKTSSSFKLQEVPYRTTNGSFHRSTAGGSSLNDSRLSVSSSLSASVESGQLNTATSTRPSSRTRTASSGHIYETNSLCDEPVARARAKSFVKQVTKTTETLSLAVRKLSAGPAWSKSKHKELTITRITAQPNAQLIGTTQMTNRRQYCAYSNSDSGLLPLQVSALPYATTLEELMLNPWIRRSENQDPPDSCGNVQTTTLATACSTSELLELDCDELADSSALALPIVSRNRCRSLSYNGYGICSEDGPMRNVRRHSLVIQSPCDVSLVQTGFQTVYSPLSSLPQNPSGLMDVENLRNKLIIGPIIGSGGSANIRLATFAVYFDSILELTNDAPRAWEYIDGDSEKLARTGKAQTYKLLTGCWMCAAADADMHFVAHQGKRIVLAVKEILKSDEPACSIERRRRAVSTLVKLSRADHKHLKQLDSKVYKNSCVFRKNYKPLKADRRIVFGMHMRNPFPRIYGVCDTNENLFYVMERLEGLSLSRLLPTLPLPEKETANIVGHILRCLDRIHKVGLVHRDVKLENIMTETYVAGRLKFVDFGLCCRSEDCATSKPEGTAAYAAPEVSIACSPPYQYSSRVDMWAVGIITYLLLQGSFPFGAQGIKEYISTIATTKNFRKKSDLNLTSGSTETTCSTDFSNNADDDCIIVAPGECKPPHLRPSSLKSYNMEMTGSDFCVPFNCVVGHTITDRDTQRAASSSKGLVYIKPAILSSLIAGLGDKDPPLSSSCLLFVSVLLRPNPTTRPSAEQALLHPWLQEQQDICLSH